MKISYNWLKDYVAVSGSPEQLAHRLTLAGLEVEKVHSVGQDAVLELEITPNRPDCLNLIGIARETAAILNKPFKPPQDKRLVPPQKKTDVKITDKNLCSRYIGVVIRNVNVGPSPRWLRERLEALGLRSINNIVDITNFCLLELGQPLHAFDYDQLIGKKIIVRRAKDGEGITTIDGEVRKLDSSILVIADGSRPVAVAGIMGGRETEVTAATKNIFLESAYFDPAVIRRAGRTLGLASDSSYRFERSVDIEGVAAGAWRAVHLIQKIVGGTVEAYCDQFPGKIKSKPAAVRLSPSQISSFLGAPIPAKRCQTILKKLGFKVSVARKNFLVTPPSFRRDIQQPVDIMEEIARITGYDAVALTYPTIKASNIATHPAWLCRNRLRDFLTSQGLDEVITYVLISRKLLDKSGLAVEKGLCIQNPLTRDQEILRPYLLPGLLSVLSLNINRGQKNLRCFELGKIYSSILEREALGILLTGERCDDWRLAAKEPVNFFDLKGCVEGALKDFRVENITFEKIFCPAFEEAQSVELKIDGQAAGILGKVSPAVLEAWDIKHAQVYFAQIEIEGLAWRLSSGRRYQPVPEFPAIVRDVSVAVKNGISFAAVQSVIWPLGEGFLESIKFLEEYRGEKIPAGHRGLVFSLTYQSLERTLTEEEIHQIHERICQALVERLGAVRR